MSQQTPPQRVRTSQAWPILILLLAAVLRLFRIGQQSLWADEGNSVALAARTLAQISRNAAADIHPPLYYWLLHFWMQILGDGETAVRLLSALLGIVLVWLVYLIGSRLHNARSGLLAALLAAINPFLIYYSQEARMYALLAALATLLFYGLIRFILHESVILPADGSGKTVAFSAPATAMIALSAVAGLYTHYTFPIILGTATLIYLLWIFHSRRRGFFRERLLHWVLLLIVIAFFFSPWLSTAWRQLTSWPNTAQALPLSQILNEILHLLALGPVSSIAAGSPWTVVFASLFALGLWPWARPGRRRAHWLTWFLPLAWLAAPILLMVVGGLFKDAFLKFLLVAAPPFCLLMAQGISGFAGALARQGGPRPGQTPRPQTNRQRSSSSKGRRAPTARSRGPATQELEQEPGQALGLWLSRIWIGLALVLAAFPTATTLQAYYFDPAQARDNYRGMAAYIDAVSQPQDAIILNAPGQQEVFLYYYDGDLPVYALPEQRPIDPEATIARLQEIAGQHRYLYLLLWATDESDPEHVVEGWLDTHAYQASDVWQGNVRFAAYATQQSSAGWPVQESDVILGEQVRLLSYALSTQVVTAGEIVQLQLRWQAIAQPAGDYTIFTQLLDERDQVVAQRDAPPVSGGRPTSGWQPGEEILDNHGLLVLPATPPGDYRLIVGMYDPSTNQRLSTGAVDYVDLETIRVERPANPPVLTALDMQISEPFTFEEVTLLGHDRYRRGFRHEPNAPLRPNDLLHLTFYWRADVQPTAAWRFTARLVQGSDQEVAALSGPLVSDRYPTLNWEAGEVVRGEHDMQLPDYLKPGRYQLQLFLHTGNPEAVVDRVILGNIVISDS